MISSDSYMPGKYYGTLFCDGVGCKYEFSESDMGWDSKPLHRLAAELGWSYDGERHYCKACQVRREMELAGVYEGFVE